MKNQILLSLTVLLFNSEFINGSTKFSFENDKPNPKVTKDKVIKPIIGGTQVGINEIPYQILIAGGENGGGTLINKRWILTAAHVANKNGLLLYGGVTNRQQLSFGQNRTYKQHKSHPKYGDNGSSTRPSNDIALIEATAPFSGINSVQLASNSNIGLWDRGVAVVTSPYLEAQVSGFGNTAAGGTLSDNLLKVTVPIKVVDNTLNKIEAGSNGYDSCQGDSGGPLLANPSGSNNKLQIGIVSSGGNCGTSIGVYTMVSKYLDFITQTLHLYGTPDFVCNNTHLKT
jgi:secreted trypsin-like serine protease